jgi:putative CocE/NonD family hydrolase
MIDSRNHPPPASGAAVDILFRQPVPAPGGVLLAAMVFKPRGQVQPLPVIVEMTPYGADWGYADGVRFANEGFVFVSVDCRGTGESEGTFAPVVNEAADFTAVFDWLVAQPWCDGQVATFGGSYSGMNQWLALGTGHPALRTIVPSAAAILGRNMPGGGIGTLYNMRWASLSASHGTYMAWFGDVDYWHRAFEDAALHGTPAAQLPEQLFGHPLPWHQQNLAHTGFDTHWSRHLPTPETYAAWRAPVLSITGQYDSCQTPALEHHRRLLQWGSDAARRGSHLVIGPWNHAGCNDGNPQVGSLRFADTCRLDIMGLKLAWYRWVMQGGEKPAALQRGVLWYETGTEAWHACDTLAEVTAARQPQALAAADGPNDVFHSGWLASDAPVTPPYQFICDPGDEALLDIEREPRADAVQGLFAGNNSLFMTLGGEEPTSHAYATHLRGQGLVYHSAPLEAPLALAGVPVLDLRCAVDQPDADLVMLLYEIRADGRAIFLSGDALRLRYRNGYDQECPVASGEAMTLRFGDARFFARTLARHSRIRLVVRHGMSLTHQRNGNSGKPVHEETLADRRVATVTVLHDGPERSRLWLPLAAEHPAVALEHAW